MAGGSQMELMIPALPTRHLKHRQTERDRQERAGVVTLNLTIKNFNNTIVTSSEKTYFL